MFCIILFLDVFDIECDMNFYSNHVITKLHHNTEHWNHVTDYEQIASYKRALHYFAPDEYIEELKNQSVSCYQYMYMECHHSQAMRNTYWVNFHGDQLPYQYTDDRPCKCRIDKACTEDGKTE